MLSQPAPVPPELLEELLELEEELLELEDELLEVELVELDELELLELEEELLLDEELEELLDVPPHVPKLVHDASLPGTVLVYQFAR